MTEQVIVKGDDVEVLLLVVEGYHLQAEIARQMGWSRQRTWLALSRLANKGLVTWEPRTAGTTRALVTTVIRDPERDEAYASA